MGHWTVPYLLSPAYLACMWAWFLRVGKSTSSSTASRLSADNYTTLRQATTGRSSKHFSSRSRQYLLSFRRRYSNRGIS